MIYPPKAINLSKPHQHTAYGLSDCIATVLSLKVNATLATVSDLFLDFLSASVEKLKTASRCCCEFSGKRKQKGFKRGCCVTNEQLPETNHTSKPLSASAVKSNIA